MKDEKLREIEKILKDFDLPEYRKTGSTIHNLLWLFRNIHIKNANHPKKDEAISLIKEVLIERNGLKGIS